MRIDDELLDRLGDYFIDHRIGYAFNITFEQFLEEFQRGRWQIAALLISWKGVPKAYDHHYPQHC
ncbi:hypothetical protein [Paenibacillus sp. FSL R7-0331]|uniref:hypothetical protein n=1 Tax=Paenibacillus sp. FSL R7-0331 TaxID=1536773 RepID=UPI0004F8E064|nr:hypothetical protein [Paenibacillus sp. FSL R7-0331]AIQ54548.1 hypothetical protein R70331_25545 [Paenibacillus sp. FSL R7-0331]